VLKSLQQKHNTGQKSLAVLIDPDKVEDLDEVFDLGSSASRLGVDYIFVGGSMITNDMLKPVVRALKTFDVPVVLFPGSYSQVVDKADAILFLSLISGRNPEYLIGQHVQAARKLQKSTLEIIPTGYMLVGSANSSVSYVSNTLPIPFEKSDIAVNTAIAGDLLGHQLIFLDAGSGVEKSASDDMITQVSAAIRCPLIVGGGIRTPDDLRNKFQSGADLVVLGNILEKNTSILKSFCEVKRELNVNLNVH